MGVIKGFFSWLQSATSPLDGSKTLHTASLKSPNNVTGEQLHERVMKDPHGSDTHVTVDAGKQWPFIFNLSPFTNLTDLQLLKQCLFTVASNRN